jgi:hypothetical protein
MRLRPAPIEGNLLLVQWDVLAVRVPNRPPRTD